MAYALTYIHSPRELDTQIGAGSNDGVRLWLNDRLIHHPSVTRHASPNEDIVAVNFQKGWNKVLVKIDQLGLRWGLFFNVSDPERILTFNSKH